MKSLFSNRPSRSPLRSHVALYVLASFGLTVACGGEDDSGSSDSSASDVAPGSIVDDGATSDGTTVVAAPANGAAGVDSDELLVTTGEDGVGGTTDTGGEAYSFDECGGTSYGAEPKALEMYVLFDDSGSWSDDHWRTVKDAVNGFISDEASDGLGVALSFFGSQCDADRFVTPQVDMDMLPNHRTELQNVLQAKDKDGETVTQPALLGGIEFARNRLADGVNSRIVILLVTDGEPDESDCDSVPEMDNDIPAVAMTAATGFDADVSIPTYVLAVAGGDELTQNLQTIAVAGGTDQAINADPATLSEVFTEIRNQELAGLPCEYNLPDAYSTSRNPDLVNLTFGGNPLPRVADSAECETSPDGGWYYDDPTAPTRILVCSATCDTFKAAPADQTVNIALGCPTVRVTQAK